MEKQNLKDIWKEIIDTANNQDPHYSFELFEGTLEETRQGMVKIEDVEKMIKKCDCKDGYIYSGELRGELNKLKELGEK